MSQISLKITPENFEVDKVTGSFPILRFAEVSFRNLSIFWPTFISNDVRSICDVTTLP